ncbi:MAG: S-adenosylmethionine:tRNA ribosyltransferase-isomerase [Deltaproteobacteria bacterium]|nr:S-adenosylmethionine:tRNA ribosyltransferase-isomerase [Deltaproteobacteria bacterium]
MKLSEFDYNLPKDLIAQFPADKRDESRLMVLSRTTGTIEHKRFFEITEYLKNGDVLVLNDTRVIPARLYGKKSTSGEVEVFLLNVAAGFSLRESTRQVWKCLIGNSKGIKPESEIHFEHGLNAKVIKKNADESWLIELSVGQASRLSVIEAIDKIGIMPLPPYIKRGKGNNPLISPAHHSDGHPPSLGKRGTPFLPPLVKGDIGGLNALDRERYQTVFAKKEGAVAAPTAGLHFTNELLANIKSIGVEIQYITLHTGWGTFKPVKVDDITKHKMPKEYYEISNKVFESIKNAKKENRRIIAVGTTATRTLETCVKNGWDNPILEGCTDLFVYPGFNFKVVDAIVTNFHLPKSTLLMLVSAFAGRDFIMKAYKTAIENNYRFFSYGDAMLIV